MSEQETQGPSQLAQMKPYLFAAGILFVILLIAFFWPVSDDSDSALVSTPVPVVIPDTAENARDSLDGESGDAPALNGSQTITDTEAQTATQVGVESDVFNGTPEIQALEIEAGNTTLPEAVVPDPLPIDESDSAIKTALVSVAENPAIAQYLVSEDLLQKFVINVNNIANAEMSPTHSLLNEPEDEFRVYQQADRDWIDAASFKRYNAYVDALASMDAEDLIALLDTYRPTIESKFSEISMPGSSFNSTLLSAINELLDTPIVPLPIEVYSDSVMYKYKDEKLENLSGPQKQILRTGPENTRKIKQVLRDLRDALQDS
ncbi:DUF3014 domain-containing protein [Glaciecola sp. MH2013]|uniref:DUF3014 domain-containing protein n=1 Tax=Glaciecola sp. MH2013 TaxID=2785524 RepID=UPI00189CF8D5|nr:DUF3014 domain-containing protein [Glaciecola sp. MH2013]MBF7074475.1 DUF3014 domain-containing protein [Glaciecola sp. MH2013]